MILILLLFNIIFTNAYPTFLIHGIASNKNEMTEMKDYLESYNIITYNIEIGNGEFDSIFMNMNKQCSILNDEINKVVINNDINKFNIIGISQGGLLARCYVERYSNNYNINTLMTMGTPHMGIYDKNIPNLKLEYWVDPFNYDDYLKNNDYLVYINNDNKINDTYKSNIIKLNNFIIIWSSIDTIIKPVESSKFEFYNIDIAKYENKLIIQNLYDSLIYKNDNIGLKTLGDRLKILQQDCEHNKFKTYECFNKIFNKTIIFLY